MLFSHLALFVVLATVSAKSCDTVTFDLRETFAKFGVAELEAGKKFVS